ncbi:MAG: hypothetical protein WC802_00050 [Patescibacteria group bacterium]|jgi:hypothetical protein
MSESAVPLSFVWQGEEIRQFDIDQDGGQTFTMCLRVAKEMASEQYPASTLGETAVILSPFFIYLVLLALAPATWFAPPYLNGLTVGCMVVSVISVAFLTVRIEERRSARYFERQSTVKPYVLLDKAIRQRNECVATACAINALHERLLKKRPLVSSPTLYELKRETCLENARVLSHRFKQLLADVQRHARLTNEGAPVTLPQEVEVSITKFARDVNTHLIETSAEAPTLEEY